MQNLNCLDCDCNRNIAINFEEINSNESEWKFSHCIWIVVQIDGSEKCSFTQLPAIWFLSADCVEFAAVSAVLLSLLSAIATDKNWTKSTCKCSEVLLLTRNFLIVFILLVSCTLQSTQSAVHDHFQQIKSETRFDFLHLFGFTFYSFVHRHPIIGCVEWISCSIQNFSSSSCLCLLKLERKFKLIEFSFVSCFITRSFMARINVFMHQRWTRFMWASVNIFNCFIHYVIAQLIYSLVFIHWGLLLWSSLSLLFLFLIPQTFLPLDRCHKQFETLANSQRFTKPTKLSVYSFCFC